ncbi:MAG: nucleotide exchange factor GrpE [Planctomycetes bacterium]|nr:nucleotide exchange factor GrpE [Planctomycetota bacterium]
MKDTETNEQGEPVETEETVGEGADLAAVTAQRDEYLASWQRSQADYQNLRRRLQTDIDSATARGKVPLLQDLLLVLDYLDMALAAPCTSAEGKNLQAGVEMTKGQLVRALEREGVKQVAETGPFDAAVHQAVERIETDEVPPNTIVSTMRKGYTQNGAVLRPAQVRVAAEINPSSESEDN